jgi:hypothetical protein
MKVTIAVKAVAKKNFTLDEVMELFTPEEMKDLAGEMIRLAFKPEIKRDALYTYREVATLTSVSFRTIQNAVKNGHLKADYIGSEPRMRGAYRFALAQITRRFGVAHKLTSPGHAV